MRIITWNVNSIRTRLERCLALLERHDPDVVLLQELKVQDDAFPHDAFEGTNWIVTTHGQKTYNGVAIISRASDGPPDDIVRGLEGDDDDAQARLIAGTIRGVRVLSAYIPNGSKVDSDKYPYKLRWYERLRERMSRETAAWSNIVLGGDFNCALDDADVNRVEKWAESVLCTDAVRDAMKAVMATGLRDVFREHHPDGGVFSWWDYRQLGFPKNNGLRIDHLLASPAMADSCTASSIDRDERKGKQPSDHAPVIGDFDVPSGD